MSFFKITMNDTGVLRVLSDAMSKSKDLSPVMGEIENELLAISDESFANLWDPDTRSAWPPLAESTMIERAILGYSPDEVLQRTGILRRSVQTESDKNSAEIGASVEYGIYHQTGTSKMPARPFVGAAPEEQVGFEELIADFILR